MNRIENLKTEIEDLNTSLREVENLLSDAKRGVDQQQQLYDTSRDVGVKARARTNLDESLRKFDKLSRDKEQLQESKKEKNQKLKELQLQEREEANKPLREKAEELAQQLNRKQDEIVSILREIEDLHSQFQPTHKHDHLINWQNSNAQLIIDNLPYLFWIENSTTNPHYRLVKLSDKEMRN
jgi:DNA repair exonuclease SbcCD ATPase subunit